jgi:hypothetical protein
MGPPSAFPGPFHTGGLAMSIALAWTSQVIA